MLCMLFMIIFPGMPLWEAQETEGATLFRVGNPPAGNTSVVSIQHPGLVDECFRTARDINDKLKESSTWGDSEKEEKKGEFCITSFFQDMGYTCIKFKNGFGTVISAVMDRLVNLAKIPESWLEYFSGLWEDREETFKEAQPYTPRSADLSREEQKLLFRTHEKTTSLVQTINPRKINKSEAETRGNERIKQYQEISEIIQRISRIIGGSFLNGILNPFFKKFAEVTLRDSENSHIIIFRTDKENLITAPNSPLKAEIWQVWEKLMTNLQGIKAPTVQERQAQATDFLNDALGSLDAVLLKY